MIYKNAFKKVRWPLSFLAIGMFSLAALHPIRAQAEAQQLRIARQLGLGYLQLYIAEDQHLIEKHAKADGLGDVSVSYLPLGSPAAITDAVLSGSADLAGTGVPPFILLWAKSSGKANVKALTALNAQPAFLNTNKPDIKSLKDFGPDDRIALPSVGSSFQAILLDMAAEKAFGTDGAKKLDDLTVSMSHPDGAVSLISGHTEVTGHFTSPPFQYQELQHPNVHRVLSSYEITGPATFSVLWGTSKFHDANPKLMQAVVEAIDEATAFIKSNPEKAAKIFVKIEHTTLPVDFVTKILRDPDLRYSASPENITKFSDFMTRSGLIKQHAGKWQDLFFTDIASRAGS